MKHFSFLHFVSNATNQFDRWKALQMLPKDAIRVPCSLLLKASPRSLNPDVGKHSKHVCLILGFPGYQAVSRRSQSAWSSRIQQRPQTALRAVRADRVSRRAQQCASELLTSSEQQLLGDYSTPVTEHTGEHAQSLPLSLSLSQAQAYLFTQSCSFSAWPPS